MRSRTALNLLLVFFSIEAVGTGADLVVSVQIDGHSHLLIGTGAVGGPAQIIWDHLAAARPGSAGGTYPTSLNGFMWFPKWPDVPNGIPAVSSPLEIAAFA